MSSGICGILTKNGGAGNWPWGKVARVTYLCLFHRAIAAALAISFSLRLESFAALAGPPFIPPSRPSATAAAFFPSGVMGAGCWLVAESTMDLASWFSSTGLLDRLGMTGVYHIRAA